MRNVASSLTSCKRPSRSRVVVRDLIALHAMRRHVDHAENELQRAREARADDERAQALRMVRRHGLLATRMLPESYASAVGARYAEQAARLVEIADAIKELEQDADGGTVVYLSDLRARRAAKAARA